ncbi:MAG: hypothetical protein ACOYXT_16990 [Bacteroidota bacterium]
MKRGLLFLVFALSLGICKAQQPFKEYGYKVKIATLSKGKYVEFFDQDTLVQIGSVIINRLNGRIVSFVTYDTSYHESDLNPELISRWMSPDPLAEEFYSWSPYTFGFDNPVRFTDPTGMAPDDVILTGNQAKQAFAQLQAAVNGQLTLSMDDQGKVTYTKNGDGALGEGAQKLANAIDDHSSQVVVNASSSTTLPDGEPVLAGTWLGTTITGQTTSDGTPVVQGNQQVNPKMLGEIDSYYGTPGKSILHEVTESYEGTKLTQITGQEYKNSLENPGEFKTVHINATQPNNSDVKLYDHNNKFIPSGSNRIIDAVRGSLVVKAPGKPEKVITSFPVKIKY